MAGVVGVSGVGVAVVVGVTGTEVVSGVVGVAPETVFRVVSGGGYVQKSHSSSYPSSVIVSDYCK